MKIEVNISKWHFMLIVSTFAILAGAIFAYAVVAPAANPGHSVIEVSGLDANSEGVVDRAAVADKAVFAEGIFPWTGNTRDFNKNLQVVGNGVNYRFSSSDSLPFYADRAGIADSFSGKIDGSLIKGTIDGSIVSKVNSAKNADEATHATTAGSISDTSTLANTWVVKVTTAICPSSTKSGEDICKTQSLECIGVRNPDTGVIEKCGLQKNCVGGTAAWITTGQTTGKFIALCYKL